MTLPTTPATTRVSLLELSAEELEWLHLLQQIGPEAKAAFRSVIELAVLIDQLPAHQQQYLRLLVIELMQSGGNRDS